MLHHITLSCISTSFRIRAKSLICGDFFVSSYCGVTAKLHGTSFYINEQREVRIERKKTSASPEGNLYINSIEV
jgi:hypothetical protein